MNLCIFSIQTVILTILVVQYYYINEVEAESQNAANWYNSVEKKFEAVQNAADPELTKQEAKEKKTAPKRTRRVVKKYRRRVNKPDHLHVPHEQRLDVSDQQDKAEPPKKVVRRVHKKRNKDRVTKKFVKSLPRESNSSESEEVKRRKPVDIIVHIKMND